MGVPLLLGLAHVALVAPHYFVGSFDDDAGYILAARAFVAGHGLTAHLANGTVVAGSFPPGYSALLAPLVWLWPHTFVPLRLLSAACFAALFPLTWAYLDRRRVGEPARIATLVVLALGPPLATYGSMVMAETPFLVLLLGLLILVDRWEVESGVWTRTGVAAVLAAAGLVWLKEAGVGLVAGLVLWLLMQRRPASRRRALLVAVGTVALLLPVVVARLVGGVPLAGSRYSQELGTYYQGGLASRLVHVAPHGIWQMLSTALPATLVPYLSPLPIHGHDPDVWKVLSWHVTALVVVGAVVWARRHRDAAVVMVAVYLAETVLWPFVNERRVILVLPLLAAWYVLGAQAVWHGVRSWARPPAPSAGGSPAPHRLVRTVVHPAVAALVVIALVVGPLSFQFPRDYLTNLGQDTSHFAGSRYAGILAHLGAPGDVVETDYLSSAALFTGHATAWAAFENTVRTCDLSAIQSGLATDDAGYLLLGDLNKPGVLDRPCLLATAASSPWAVRLLHTQRDDASVFELIGPGTGHPDLKDLTAGVTETAGPGPAGATIRQWDWRSPSLVTQVSVGEAGTPGATASVALQLLGANGTWRTVAATASSVGDGAGAAPYLLTALPPGTTATALRVVMTEGAPAGGGAPAAFDVHALGPGAGP